MNQCQSTDRVHINLYLVVAGQVFDTLSQTEAFQAQSALLTLLQHLGAVFQDHRHQTRHNLLGDRVTYDRAGNGK